MFSNHKTSFQHNQHLSSNHQTSLSSVFRQTSSTFSNFQHFSMPYQSFDPHSSFVLSPIPSEYNSLQNEVGVRQSISFHQQPIANPHAHLLNRTLEACPSHLAKRKRTRWIKAGVKAQHNQELISSLPNFLWPDSYYDPPIHIHYRTPELVILGLIYKLSNVRLFTIDTEADRPTRQNPHSLPALIQIQAIHHETYSTVLLIEVQHLPLLNTSLHCLIQRLCRMIFSPTNKILAWGDVSKELQSFVSFDLFDLAQITNTLNLQNYFTLQWNQTHPHTDECLLRHQSTASDSSSADVLICLVNSDDLDDDYDDSCPTDDFNTCICPQDIRPYKAKASVWSLQKAIQFVFHEAIDKSMTLNFWSCGLDISLRTWHSSSDRDSRLKLIHYAIHDLFGPTKLFYYLERAKMSAHRSPDNIYLHTIFPSVNPERASLLIISDSHGRYLPPVTVRSNYILNVKAISGLHWNYHYNSQLCCKALVTSSLFSSLLSTSRCILFLVGSNSIRSAHATNILLQVEEIIHILRTQHPHLNNDTSIIISSIFPCLKLSAQFSTLSSLLTNIQLYNDGLAVLSHRQHFSIVNFPITQEHLSRDGLHIDIQHLPIIYEYILKYFDDSLATTSARSVSKRRSREAITRRNKRRHDKLKNRRTSYILQRSVAGVWHIRDVKQYLKYQNIRYGRLLEIRHHTIRIQFNNLPNLQHADEHLLPTEFDESHYHMWTSRPHP